MGKTARALGAVTVAFAAWLGAVPALRAAPSVGAVVETYAEIALATYEDSLEKARVLKSAVDTLLAAPSEATLHAAREAWKAARVPYMQSEAYRFGNKIVDEWEGKVNAWPLDEGLIDYVDPSYGTASDSNRLYTANVIANRTLTIAGRPVDAGDITAALLETLHEAEKIEANVSIGYHAIEFLLWGQDLNGTGPGAGRRPASDFDPKACTGGHCERRARYLRVVTALLVDHLARMVESWKPRGAARRALEGDDTAALTAIVKGLGSLAYGELAGERMKLGLLLNDPEEEHDCFSDNTHNSHYYNTVGLVNVYRGRYRRSDGRQLEGASLSDLVRAKDPAADERVRAALDGAMARMTALKMRAETVEAYDQMIGEGNTAGNAVVEAAIGALVAFAKELERAIAVLELKAVEFERSQSLDDPAGAASRKK